MESGNAALSSLLAVPQEGENGEGDVYVDGLKEKPVFCQDDIFTYMKEGVKSRLHQHEREKLPVPHHLPSENRKQQPGLGRRDNDGGGG